MLHFSHTYVLCMVECFSGQSMQHQSETILISLSRSYMAQGAQHMA